jgi:hypothetical protein
MLTFLRDSGRLSERKARLFAVASCRRILHPLTGERTREALDVLERYSDGLATQRQLEAAYTAADASNDPYNYPAQVATYATTVFGPYADQDAIRFAYAADVARLAARAARPTQAGELAAQAVLLRELFGPLAFRRMKFPQAVRTWGDGTVVRLAHAAYEERLFPSGHLDPQRLVGLSDALEEAGADAELVAHLRGPGSHVRGCHILDLLLAKE